MRSNVGAAFAHRRQALKELRRIAKPSRLAADVAIS
jgi:hypothetical protein